MVGLIRSWIRQQPGWFLGVILLAQSSDLQSVWLLSPPCKCSGFHLS